MFGLPVNRRKGTIAFLGMKNKERFTMQPQHILDPTSTIILCGLAQLYGDGVKLSMGNSVPHQMTIQPAGVLQSVSRTMTKFTSIMYSEQNSDKRAELWRLRPHCVKAARLLSPKMVFLKQQPHEKEPPQEPDLSRSLKVIFKWAVQGLENGPKKTYESEKTDEGYTAAGNIELACKVLSRTLKGRANQLRDCPGIDDLNKIDFSRMYSDDQLILIGSHFTCIEKARDSKEEYDHLVSAILKIVEGVTQKKLVPLFAKQKEDKKEEQKPPEGNK
jgi:hypothetical protein